MDMATARAHNEIVNPLNKRVPFLVLFLHLGDSGLVGLPCVDLPPTRRGLMDAANLVMSWTRLQCRVETLDTGSQPPVGAPEMLTYPSSIPRATSADDRYLCSLVEPTDPMTVF